MRAFFFGPGLVFCLDGSADGDGALLFVPAFDAVVAFVLPFSAGCAEGLLSPELGVPTGRGVSFVSDDLSVDSDLVA